MAHYRAGEASLAFASVAQFIADKHVAFMIRHFVMFLLKWSMLQWRNALP